MISEHFLIGARQLENSIMHIAMLMKFHINILNFLQMRPATSVLNLVKFNVLLVSISS